MQLKSLMKLTSLIRYLYIRKVGLLIRKLPSFFFISLAYTDETCMLHIEILLLFNTDI